MHPFFDGLRTASEEEQLIKERDREKSLKRTESSTNPRGTCTMSRNGDQSRSRSGLRNTKIAKGGPITNQKRFNQASTDPIHQDFNAKSRSLGRKNNEKNQMIMN